MSTRNLTETWLLPEGVEELLPQEAEFVERLRRDLLDLFHRHGYELVMPPLIEYLGSLLIGTGNDLDLQTFKTIDQLSGRLLGVRADMTPQVARIDAHRLRRDTPARLCYMGTVLRSRAETQGGSRIPLQVGAELYGHAGVESDVEVLCLMLEVLGRLGLKDVYVDLGHVGIFRALSRQAGLTPEQEQTLFDALQRKARPEIAAYLATLDIDAEAARMLLALAELNGGHEVLAQARQRLARAGDGVHAAIDDLERIALLAGRRAGFDGFHFDLAELRGYHYHTGAVFAAYVPGSGQAVAQGGRYDDIGLAFGRARPATGFSADLKALLELIDIPRQPAAAVYAPPGDEAGLREAIRALRAQGRRVIEGLPGQRGGAAEMGCTELLARQNGNWTLTKIETN